MGWEVGFEFFSPETDSFSPGMVCLPVLEELRFTHFDPFLTPPTSKFVPNHCQIAPGRRPFPLSQQIWALFASEHSFSPSLTVSGHLDTSGGPPLGGRWKVVCRPLGSGKLTTLGFCRSRGLPPGLGIPVKSPHCRERKSPTTPKIIFHVSQKNG